MERTEQPNADEVEEDVMNQLPTLNAEKLEELCNLVDIAVDAGVKGNKKMLRKMLFKHLCTEDTDDNKMEACLLYTSPSPRDRTRSRMPSSA